MPTGRKPYDITGQRFGRLVALYRIGPRKELGTHFWKLRCDCGNEVEVGVSTLRSNHTQSCGCLQKQIMAVIRSKPDSAVREVMGHYKAKCRQYGISGRYNKVRGRAKGMDLTFNLSQEEFKKLTSSPCYYTGLPPQKEFKGYRFNGLDRLDNSKGYVTGNVVPCCWQINRMKAAMSESEFINLCRLVALHHPA